MQPGERFAPRPRVRSCLGFSRHTRSAAALRARRLDGRRARSAIRRAPAARRRAAGSALRPPLRVGKLREPRLGALAISSASLPHARGLFFACSRPGSCACCCAKRSASVSISATCRAILDARLRGGSTSTGSARRSGGRGGLSASRRARRARAARRGPLGRALVFARARHLFELRAIAPGDRPRRRAVSLNSPFIATPSISAASRAARSNATAPHGLERRHAGRSTEQVRGSGRPVAIARERATDLSRSDGLGDLRQRPSAASASASTAARLSVSLTPSNASSAMSRSMASACARTRVVVRRRGRSRPAPRGPSAWRRPRGGRGRPRPRARRRRSGRAPRAATRRHTRAGPRDRGACGGRAHESGRW